MRLIEKIGAWFDQRLQLAAPAREIMEHPVPSPAFSSLWSTCPQGEKHGIACKF
jgi:hypothetical protein